MDIDDAASLQKFRDFLSVHQGQEHSYGSSDQLNEVASPTENLIPAKQTSDLSSELDVVQTSSSIEHAETESLSNPLLPPARTTEEINKQFDCEDYPKSSFSLHPHPKLQGHAQSVGFPSVPVLYSLSIEHSSAEQAPQDEATEWNTHEAGARNDHRNDNESALQVTNTPQDEGKQPSEDGAIAEAPVPLDGVPTKTAYGFASVKSTVESSTSIDARLPRFETYLKQLGRYTASKVYVSDIPIANDMASPKAPSDTVSVTQASNAATASDAIDQQVPSNAVSTLQAFDTAATIDPARQRVTRYDMKSLKDLKKDGPDTPHSLELRNYSELQLVASDAKSGPADYPAIQAAYEKSLAAVRRRLSGQRVNAWPRAVQRTGPPAQIRRVTLHGIPPGADADVVARLVFKGPIEQIIYVTGSTTAQVLFINGEDCTQYVEATKQGLLIFDRYRGSLPSFIHVTKSTTVDIMSSLTKEQVDRGATRCVRVRGIAPGKEFDRKYLLEMVAKEGGKLQHLEIERSSNGCQELNFLFFRLTEAIRFRKFLMVQPLFEDTNIQFGQDPCAIGTPTVATADELYQKTAKAQI